MTTCELLPEYPVNTRVAFIDDRRKLRYGVVVDVEPIGNERVAIKCDDCEEIQHVECDMVAILETLS